MNSAQTAAPAQPKAAHTPGPWHVDAEMGMIVDAANKTVLMAPAWAPTEDRWSALHLAASAPELLAALELVVNSGPLNNGLRDENTLAVARAAINSAKGQS